ncbi:MAG: hypothetical protein HOJ79_11920 [Nitrospina sp.]|nr:hypothetical protein [Nitrospina sp.]
MMTQIDQTRSQPDYEATLTVRDNKYFLYIHELQLIAQGDNLDSAYNELNRIKDERIKSFEMAGILDKLPAPSQSAQQKENALRRKDMGLFLLKILSAGFMFVLIINFAGTKINNAVVAAPEKIKSAVKELPRQIALELEYQVHNAAETEISQDRGRKIRSSLRTLGKNIKPYLDEFNHGLSETDLDKEF